MNDKMEMLGFSEDYSPRARCVEALMNAANAKIKVTVTKHHDDFIPGDCEYYSEEIENRRYARKTDITNIVTVDGGPVAVTTVFVDGLGPAVTQTITHEGGITTICDYSFVVPYNDDYDSVAVHRAADAIKAHDQHHADYIRLLLEEDSLTVTESMEVNSAFTTTPCFTDQKIDVTADEVAWLMVMDPDADSLNAIASVTTQFDPCHQPPDRWFLPVSVQTCYWDFDRYANEWEATLWKYDIEIIRKSEPTDPREYAGYVGAREY